MLVGGVGGSGEGGRECVDSGEGEVYGEKGVCSWCKVRGEVGWCRAA